MFYVIRALTKALIEAPSSHLGLYNTGTNYLAKLLSLNGLGGPSFFELKHYRPEFLLYAMHTQVGAADGAAVGVDGAAAGEWHPSAPEVLRVGAIGGRELLFVVLVRNPLSLLHSWRSASYDLLCEWDNTARWLHGPCAAYFTHDAEPRKGGRVVCRDQYTDPMSVWNEYHRAWSNSTLIPQDSVIVIKYEDLTVSPLRELNRLLAAAGQALMTPESFTSVDANAKADHYGLVINRKAIGGRPRTRAEIIASLARKDYLSAFSADELELACAKLDHQLLRRYGYESDCNTHQQTTER
jgi:hypothetical protein